MPRVYECEECGKIIHGGDEYIEVNIESKTPGMLAQQKGRVHADEKQHPDCLPNYRKKHPRLDFKLDHYPAARQGAADTIGRTGCVRGGSPTTTTSRLTVAKGAGLVSKGASGRTIELVKSVVAVQVGSDASEVRGWAPSAQTRRQTPSLKAPGISPLLSIRYSLNFKLPEPPFGATRVLLAFR